jgi:hypothetical protein
MRQSKCADISPLPPMHWRAWVCANAPMDWLVALARIGALAHVNASTEASELTRSRTNPPKSFHRQKQLLGALRMGVHLK